MRISLLFASLLAAASFHAFADRASPRQKASIESTRVHGLVVQLREAPTHGAMARERALSTAGNTAPLADRERARWQRAMGALPPLQLVERRAVGESALALRFHYQ